MPVTKSKNERGSLLVVEQMINLGTTNLRQKQEAQSINTISSWKLRN